MPIPFSCPHCNLETLVDDEFAGRSGACAGCGRSITVPLITDGTRLLEEDEVIVGIPHRQRSVLKIVMLVAGAIVSGVAALALLLLVISPAVSMARASAHKHSCSARLERIAAALAEYEAEHGHYPPAYVTDSAGKPMHSWRVLLLPYLGEETLYDRYDLNQPWDSPSNLEIATAMPSVYACPADPDAMALQESNYVVIVGPNTAFPGKEEVSTTDITDDVRTTITVVETPVNGVPWTQPVDLTVDKMQFAVNGFLGKEIGSHHTGGAFVLMADGRVHFLSDLVSADFLSGMTTIGGGEYIPDGVLGGEPW